MSEPAPPSTGVDICNLALGRLGSTVAVTDIATPVGKAAILCAQHYPVTRRAILRGPRVFGFAKQYAQLTVDATVTIPYGDFTSAYRLPNDFLRLLTLGDHTVGSPKDSALFDVVGRHIYTADEDEADTVNIQYIRDVTNVGLWDALFVKLCYLELAKALAPGMTVKSSLVKDIDEELRDVRLEAGAVAGQEKPPQRVTRSRWLANRGARRNPTRHSI